MKRETSNPQPGLRPLIWWVIWAALLTGYLEVCYHFAQALHPRPPSTIVVFVSTVVAAGFLLLSVAIRWLLLPRIPRLGVAFVLFLIGQALAEGCGYLGLFLRGALKETLVAAGAVGLIQYMPWFLRNLYRRTGKRTQTPSRRA